MNAIDQLAQQIERSRDTRPTPYDTEAQRGAARELDQLRGYFAILYLEAKPGALRGRYLPQETADTIERVLANWPLDSLARRQAVQTLVHRLHERHVGGKPLTDNE